MAWNAHFSFEPSTHRFKPVATAHWQLPGAIDRSTAASSTLRIAAMLGVFLVVCDLAREKAARRAILFTMALAGASIMLLGLLQKATGASMIFWQPGPARSPFFATFYYHGNAGAFINLTLPLIMAFALRSLDRGRGGGAIWFPALLIAFASAMVNVSRAASVLSIVSMVVFAVHEAISRHRVWQISRSSAAAATLVCCLALAAIVEFSGRTQAVEKWTWLKGQLNENNPRYIVERVCCDMAKDSGLFGFGPGTFAAAFPHYTVPYGDTIRGVWRYAHQDYLQTFIEWGAPGTALFAALLLGGFAHLWRGRQHPEKDPRLRFACVLALTATGLHALVDFPFQIASLQLYAAVLAGVGWAISPQKVAPRRKLEDQHSEFSALSY